MPNNTTIKLMAKNNMTAVEWFFEVLAHNDIIDHKRLCDDQNLYNLLYSLKNQAKQMEWEQIKVSYGVGHNDGCAYMTNNKPDFEDQEQYHNETFGNESV